MAPDVSATWKTRHEYQVTNLVFESCFFMWWFSSGPADLPQIIQKTVYGIIHLFCQMHEQYPYDQRLEEKVANGEQRWWHWQDKVLFTLIFIFYFFDKYDSAIKDRKVEIEPSTSGRGLQSQYAFILDMFLSQILASHQLFFRCCLMGTLLTDVVTLR